MLSPDGAPPDYTALCEAYKRASLLVLDDPLVWSQENANPEPRRLAWPRPYEGSQNNRNFSLWFNADVDVVLVILKERQDPMAPNWPPDVRDPKMQVVLRVMQRAMEAGEAALVAEFGAEFGGERVFGKRDFKNRVVEETAAEALRLQMTRSEASAMTGIGLRRGQRARERVVERGRAKGRK